MWRFVLTVGLLCWGSEGAVTCRNNNNGEVDWYILYKAPRLQAQAPAGLEYIYIDSAGTTTMKPSAPNFKPISHPDGVLANTLRPLFVPIRSMQPNFGFISYSDQPPGCNAQQTFGHSKGVLMVDKTGPGLWLLHSTPQFPFRRDQNHFWPQSGTENAQMFICVTFPYDQFRHIGKHLQYIGAFPFEHDVPGDFHQELKDAVNWVQKPPPNNFQKLTSLTSRGQPGQEFYSFAKQQSDQPSVGDLYVSLAQLVGSDVEVQTWGCQKDRKPSYCVTGKPKVINIKTIRSDLGIWKPNKDHSKWCVAKDPNDWICIADVNRAETQYKRRGGALCFQNKRIKNIFQTLAGGTDDCTASNTKDTTNSDCDDDMTDSNTPSLMG